MMIDKLIGFGLSPLGKKYIGAKSIGRCQSVGLKLISDRESEINNFIPELYFNLYLTFVKDSTVLKAKYNGYKTDVITKLTKQADAEAIITDCKNSSFSVESIKKVKHQETPKPPFCTATFQQEAASKLGLRVKDAMSCAQKLFEGININGEHKGLITYMRTDSTAITPEFIPELKQFITDNYGAQKYTGLRKSKGKKTDQNGHEALRIVDPLLTPQELSKHINNNLLIKVYNLIWQRTIAAAMPNAIISETLYTIDNKGHKFVLSVNELIDPGYTVIYKAENLETNEINASLNLGEQLENTELELHKKFTQPKARFTEASLVKELQQKEIGRPSTYATIVETILSPTRGYAKLEEKHIVPTDRGMQLADYCDRAFPSIINLNYTKELENKLDEIAAGKILWLDYMENFYKNLENVINTTNETGIAPELPEKVCPNCSSPMVVRRSRFGRLFYGCSTYPKCNGIVGID
jgi:DNA topoisomerase-1